MKVHVIKEVDRSYGVFVPVRIGRVSGDSKRGREILLTAQRLRVDPQYLASATERLERRQDGTNKKLSELLLEAADTIDVDGAVCDDVPLKFSTARLADWLIRNRIPWPRLANGALDLKTDTFRSQAKAFPAVSELRELLSTLGALKLFHDLAVGTDGRNRCMLSPFRARTGRNQPSNSRFIFGPHVWLRGLVQPPPGRSLAYIDWSQQEIAISAALSGDTRMMDAYRSGDFYLSFAKQAGAAPPNANSDTHHGVRELYKRTCLGVQYRMGEEALANYLGKPLALARRMLREHKEAYPRFWAWSERAVDHAMLVGRLETVFGWPIHAVGDVNPRSVANHPCQGNGAEMMRLAACLLVENGIRLCAPVHDAFLIETPLDETDAVVALAQELMEQASREVLGGFTVRTEATIVQYPDRYMDEKRGRAMWDRVLDVLSQIRAPEAVDTPF